MPGYFHKWLLAPACLVSITHVTHAVEMTKVLEKRCLECHGGDKVKGKVDLRDFLKSGDAKKHADLLEKMIEAVEFQDMPPEDEPELPKALREELLASLKQKLDGAGDLEFAQTPIRRMNRFQYANAVQDLFQIRCEVFALPERVVRDHSRYFNPASGKMPDMVVVGSRPLGKSQLIGKRLAGVAPFPQDLRAEHGFDNRSDHLSLSPMLMENFVKLSRSIVFSKDFNPKQVGIWNEFFAPPKGEVEPKASLRPRIQKFLTKAFRHTPEDAALDRYVGYAEQKLADGMEYNQAMREVAAAVLVSPQFLYVKHGSEGALDDFQLASRLSFFLWGSIPDETLLDLAAEKKLRQPKVLRAQAQRMMNDPKLKRFADAFPMQWLQLDRIINSYPDELKFPFFYDRQFRNSRHMHMEPLLLFETVMIENRPLLELIDPPFSYRSQGLKNWYAGVKKPMGEVTSMKFHRVPIKDRRQGGVITNAAVMTMTSGPDETQPITRGAWMLTVILNDPPEPPPADVPPLPKPSEEQAKTMTIRERFAAHRERKDCASCHVKLDPLGFAFENYDPVGLWRDKYENDLRVDATGVLFRQHKFTNPVEFKDALLKERERFAKGFIEHLLAYASAREVSPADRQSVLAVVEKTKAGNFPMREVITELILSPAFLGSSDGKEPIK